MVKCHSYSTLVFKHYRKPYFEWIDDKTSESNIQTLSSCVEGLSVIQPSPVLTHQMPDAPQKNHSNSGAKTFQTRMHSSRMRTARSSSRGEYPPGTSPGIRHPPRSRYPPRADTPLWDQAPPWSRHPPKSRHPSGPGTTLEQATLGAGTPSGAGTPRADTPRSRHPPPPGSRHLLGPGTPGRRHPQEQAPPGTRHPLLGPCIPPGPGTPLEQTPPCGQTHACKHITLPQTSFAGGSKKTFQQDAYRLLAHCT